MSTNFLPGNWVEISGVAMSYDSTKKMDLPAPFRGERGVVDNIHPSGLVGVRFKKFNGYGYQPYLCYYKEGDLIEL